MRRTALRRIGGSVTALCVLAACGSSGTKSSSNAGASATAGGPTSTQAVLTGSPIKIGWTADVTGQAFGYPGVSKAADVAEMQINAAGGINGHPLQVVKCDDKETAGGGAACFQHLTSDSSIVALVGSSSLYTDASKQLVDQAQIPLVGQTAIGAVDLTDPLSFLITGGVIGQYAGLGAAAATQGAKTAVILREDLAATGVIDTYITKSFESGGGKISGRVLIAATQTDLSAAAAQAASGNPDAILLALPATQVTAAVVALRNGGYKGMLGLGGDQVDDAYLQKLGVDPGKMFVVTVLPRASDNTTKWGALFNDALAKYAPSIPKWEEVQEVWTAIQAFAEAAKSITGPVTRASVLTALHATTALDTGGLTPPIDWSKPGPTTILPRDPNTNYDIQVAQNGTFVWDGRFHSYG